MNAASSARFRLANLLARVYGDNDNVRAVALTGSAARGWADAYSDVELHVFWFKPPTDVERTVTIERCGATLVHLWAVEDDEWSETMSVQGLRIDVSSFLVDTVDAYLQAVLVDHDIDTNKQLLLAQLHNACTLVDKDERFAAWRPQLAHYPEALARAMVRAHLVPHPRWAQRQALYEREDVVCMHELTTATLKGLLNALCAANRVYISDPSAKWWSQTIAQLTVCPTDMFRRACLAFRGEGVVALTELQALVAETCDLIEKVLPQAGALQAAAHFLESSRRVFVPNDIEEMSDSLTARLAAFP